LRGDCLDCSFGDCIAIPARDRDRAPRLFAVHVSRRFRSDRLVERSELKGGDRWDSIGVVGFPAWGFFMAIHNMKCGDRRIIFARVFRLRDRPHADVFYFILKSKFKGKLMKKLATHKLQDSYRLGLAKFARNLRQN